MLLKSIGILKSEICRKSKNPQSTFYFVNFRKNPTLKSRRIAIPNSNIHVLFLLIYDNFFVLQSLHQETWTTESFFADQTPLKI